MSEIELRKENQQSPVADEVSALIAVVRPVLAGLLYSLKGEMAQPFGGLQQVPLKFLGRLRLKGDGDVGICYEYAVHDALRRREASVSERVFDALHRYCKVPGTDIESILFGAEKTGAIQLIDTASNILTDESRLLTGRQMQPPKLKAYLNTIAAAFRRESTRKSLPTSINGLWKADLFLGCTDSDRWVGTSVKINPRQLEGANGLRVGIVPCSQGRSDKIIVDANKNLVVCPLPYDGSFVELFYYAWSIVQQVFNADTQLPREVALPTPAHRQVAKELVARRDFATSDVIDALEPLSQPHLLVNSSSKLSLASPTVTSITETLIAPISLLP